MEQSKSIGEIIASMPRLHEERKTALHIQIKDASQAFLTMLRQNIENAQWLAGYNEIGDWLSDNNNKGLILIGGCGVGKTIIAMHILKWVIQSIYDPVMVVMKAREMNEKSMNYALRNYDVKIIDDIGTEEMANDFGVRKYMLNEVVDIAEERGQLLIITTNLLAPDIVARYGERTFDRLRSICRVVSIENESLRK